MKTTGNFIESAICSLVVVAFLLSVNCASAQSPAFTISLLTPTNGETFSPPANMTLRSEVVDSNSLMYAVAYYYGNTYQGVTTNNIFIGAVTNTVLTNGDNPYPFTWTNVPTGTYAVTAIAMDIDGNVAESAPAYIAVTNIMTVTNPPPPPPPPVPFTVEFWYPTNGETLFGPTNIPLEAGVTDTNPVAAIAYYAGVTNSIFLGVVTNEGQGNTYTLIWNNPSPGNYVLTAIAYDSEGYMATSPPVNILITNSIIVTNPLPPPPVPFTVQFWYPTNGQVLLGSTNIPLETAVTDTNPVEAISYYYGNMGSTNDIFLGVITNTGQGNPHTLVWTNAPLGNYVLTAVAYDSEGNVAMSPQVNILITNSIIVTNPPPPPTSFTVEFEFPTNGETFIAPASFALQVAVTDTNTVDAVSYYYGNMGSTNNIFLGVVTNEGQGNPYTFIWTNAPLGNYALTAVAYDSMGKVATSPPVNILITNSIVVTNPPPPPPTPFTVEFWTPTNGQVFIAPADPLLQVAVTDTNPVGAVSYYYRNMSYPTNNILLGVVTNEGQGNPYTLVWTNAPLGNYVLTAVAYDSAGNVAMSPQVNILITNSIIVTNPPPPPTSFTVEFEFPTNGETFIAPASFALQVAVTDTNPVEAISYYYGNIGSTNDIFLGVVTNTGQGNPYTLVWTNAPLGNDVLTAVAYDSMGKVATSPPVNILITNSITVTNAPPVTNPPPVVSIYATDPAAISGTNSTIFTSLIVPVPTMTNYIAGTNAATFLVRRIGVTNDDVTVYYSIGGTASNGVDYVAIPGFVTIPANKIYALIPIVPICRTNAIPVSTAIPLKTVVLRLTPFTNVPPPYIVGVPACAGIVIANEEFFPIPGPMILNLGGGSLYVSFPALNGSIFCVETSTNMVNWQPICTNTVLKGSAQFVDPNGAANPMLFYRVVPANTSPTY